MRRASRPCAGPVRRSLFPKPCLSGHTTRQASRYIPIRSASSAAILPSSAPAVSPRSEPVPRNLASYRSPCVQPRLIPSRILFPERPTSAPLLARASTAPLLPLPARGQRSPARNAIRPCPGRRISGRQALARLSPDSSPRPVHRPRFAAARCDFRSPSPRDGTRCTQSRPCRSPDTRWAATPPCSSRFRPHSRLRQTAARAGSVRSARARPHQASLSEIRDG